MGNGARSASGLHRRFDPLELRRVNDPHHVTVGKADDATAFQRACRATHGFKREAEVAGDIRSGHRQVDVARGPGLPLQLSKEHRELADLASFLVSDSAGYINGEMVVQDGGAHLRSSGAEDLLQWTEAQWDKQRATRSKA